MIFVSKGTLKARMLEYFRNVEQTGDELIVTDHKKPVLKISPYRQDLSIDAMFAPYQGGMKYTGSLEAPETDAWGDAV